MELKRLHVVVENVNKLLVSPKMIVMSSYKKHDYLTEIKVL